MDNFIYKGENLREVRFPLGGIGAGSICIDGGARFVDWEIMNRPNIDTYNGFTHIAVKAEKDGKLLDARVLNGPLQMSFMGRGLHSFGGYGYGPARETMAGVPHFDDVTLKGRFPVAEYDFTGQFPAKSSLRAFSPFEPGNTFDSSLPLAMFEISLKNITDEVIDYSVAFSVSNPNGREPFNTICQKDGKSYALLSTGIDKYDPAYGELCLMTDADEVSFQQNWFKGAWFDGLAVFWNDFITPGKLHDRKLPRGGDKETSVICAHFRANAGEAKAIRFALAWYYPNFEKYWGVPHDAPKPVWRNWYATVFSGAEDIAGYALSDWKRLSDCVENFAEAMYDSSTLPAEVIDAAASNLSVLKSPTCIRLSDGSFYGWEGVHSREGSCEGSCQHVWNYQYTLPMLFPDLERSMRELDYTYNLQADGSMPFRLQLPVGSPASRFRSCVDGLMGGIIKSYREWKLCGDIEWLKRLWNKIKKSLEFTWSDENYDRWDPEKSGVITGRQHHTLDMELFGANSWLTGMYLAALEAAARMADAVGDDEFAAECREIKEKGMKLADELLWNGEYYIQKVDLKDKSILDPYKDHDPEVYKTYWNDEAGEIKYQIGDGVSIDQLFGQWHADLNGLGDIFDRTHVKKALESLFKYNFTEKIGEVFNPCRLYSLEDESGLLICSYPKQANKPVIPIPYAEETMHGFEYAAACNMILNGLEEEGLHSVRAVRDKYNGIRRNPWNEIECGGHYARSMAAWSFVIAYQGLSVDMTENAVAFNRISVKREHSSIWAFSGAWGKITSGNGKFTLACFGGSLDIKKISFADSIYAISADYNGKPISFRLNGTMIEFDDLLSIKKDDTIIISIKKI